LALLCPLAPFACQPHEDIRGVRAAAEKALAAELALINSLAVLDFIHRSKRETKGYCIGL
jgi:hypothetical protein